MKLESAPQPPTCPDIWPKDTLLSGIRGPYFYFFTFGGRDKLGQETGIKGREASKETRIMA